MRDGISKTYCLVVTLNHPSFMNEVSITNNINNDVIEDETRGEGEGPQRCLNIQQNVSGRKSLTARKK